MLRLLIFVLPLTLSLAIRVPVDRDENSTVKPTDSADKKQDTFYTSDDVNVDSYLIPPDPHRPAEIIPDIIITPATYLLPPSPEKQVDYYAPVETGEQTDWYPIYEAPTPSTQKDLPPRESDLIPILVQNNQSFEILQPLRVEADRSIFPIPSRQLQPPIENENKYHVPIPLGNQELPLPEVNLPFRNRPNFGPKLRKKPKKYFAIEDPEPTLALELTPPQIQPESIKYVKNPTKLYPKKVNQGFHPIPIPLAQFEDTSGMPLAKPVNPFIPDTGEESKYFTPSDEKKIYLYEQAEQKRRLKGENQIKPQLATDDTHAANTAEQETLETIHRHPGHPGRNIYPAPLRQSPPSIPQPAKLSAPTPPPTGERTEFRMHGMKGPHSYQFGFDTGKGKNRQFRFEERDNEGRVKGHYGYMDKRGKMRVVNYGADPEHGFHAESPQDEVEPDPQPA